MHILRENTNECSCVFLSLTKSQLMLESGWYALRGKHMLHIACDMYHVIHIEKHTSTFQMLLDAHQPQPI